MARLLIVEDQPELAALVAAAARTRGHIPTEALTGTDALGWLERRPFDAAIVDLQLPDIPGSRVLDDLRVRRIPAFAVSGVYKGDRFAREAVEEHGARAFFEKPYELKTVLDAVEAVTGGAPASAQASTAVDDLDELREIALPFGDRERVWSDEAPAPRPRAPQSVEWASAGRIQPGAIVRLLNAWYQARHTGELKLRQGPVMKVVFFEAGQPVYAASNVSHERFARFCVRRGVLPEAEMGAVAALAKESNLRTGEAMIQLGLITPDQRRELLEQQIKEIIWSTFEWSEGEYTFSARRPARTDLVKLAVFPGDLVLEGVRREPLVTLRRRMPADRRLFPSPEPPYGLQEFRLGDAEARLLVWADGSKTVEDLVALSDLGEREVLGTLYAFELLGLLEARREAAARRISFGL